MLAQPDIVEAIVLGPRYLIEDLAIEAIGRLPPLCGIAKVIPQTKTDFSRITHFNNLNERDLTLWHTQFQCEEPATATRGDTVGGEVDTASLCERLKGAG
jgi:hypothetical protein